MFRSLTFSSASAVTLQQSIHSVSERAITARSTVRKSSCKVTVILEKF
jgi:hypothetical protein